MPFIQYVLLKRNRLKAKDINAILCAWSKTRKAVPAMPGSPRGGDVVGSSSLFIHSTGQEEEREFCFMRRTREASSSFLLFKVRKEEAVEMGVGERREVMGERCTFSLASWAPSRDSRHLVVKTSKTSFPCLVSSCDPEHLPLGLHLVAAGYIALQRSHLSDSLQGWGGAVNVHALCLGLCSTAHLGNIKQSQGREVPV